MVSLLVDVAPRADPDHVDDDIIFVEDDAPVADSEPVGVPSLKLFDIICLRGGIVGILAKFRSDTCGFVRRQLRKRFDCLFAVGYFLARLVA
jgi:hypothetical protein